MSDADNEVMRTAYAHEAVLLLEACTDQRAPGGAITTALCGTSTHLGPCPLSPHHTATRLDGRRLVVRVLFAAEPDDEQAVRQRIVAALSCGRSTMPAPAETGWQLVQHRAEEVTAGEREHAARLTKQ